MVEFLGYLGSLGLSCYTFLCLFPLTLTLQNFNGFPNFVRPRSGKISNTIVFCSVSKCNMAY